MMEIVGLEIFRLWVSGGGPPNEKAKDFILG